MQQLDASGDEVLDAAELAKTPGLAAGASHIDQDSDGQLSAVELQAQLELFRSKAVAVRACRYRLMYRERPLAGAEVRFAAGETVKLR